MRDRLAHLEVGEVDILSRQIRTLLRFPPGSQVALFAATRTEPALLQLIIEFPEVSWFLPRITGPGTMEFLPVENLAALRPGSFGILEPFEGTPPPHLDAIVCPGLAFTRTGHRLGQGGGFYDRILKRYPCARKIGVAFPIQIVAELPGEAHDIPMDAVLTPTPEPPNETPEY